MPLSFDVDLDTLVRPKGRIKINGKEIEITPPDLEQVLRFSQIGARLEKLGKKNKVDDVDKTIDEIRAAFNELLPELKGEKLNLAQMLALISAITNSSMPTDTKELEKRGIKMTNDQKKTTSGS